MKNEERYKGSRKNTKRGRKVLEKRGTEKVDVEGKRLMIGRR